MKKEKVWSRRERFRDDLEDLCFHPEYFRAKVGRMSKTNFRGEGFREDTLELREVRIATTGRIVADHIWIKPDEVENKEVLDLLMRTPSCGQKTVEFSGTAYRYGEPPRGRGFHSWHGFKYALGDILIKRTSPSVRLTAVMA